MVQRTRIIHKLKIFEKLKRVKKLLMFLKLWIVQKLMKSFTKWYSIKIDDCSKKIEDSSEITVVPKNWGSI